MGTNTVDITKILKKLQPMYILQGVRIGYAVAIS
jgi:hypothetical protein